MAANVDKRECLINSKFHHNNVHPHVLQVISSEDMNVGHDYNGKGPPKISHRNECASIRVGVLLQSQAQCNLQCKSISTK